MSNYAYLHDDASYCIQTSMRISEFQIPAMAVERLSEMLSVPMDAARAQFDVRVARVILDAKFETDKHRFIIECKTSSSLGSVVVAAELLKTALNKVRDDAIPVFAAPYMSRSARDYCAREGIGWLDLSGNAKIVAPGLYIDSTGHRNKFARPGRVETPFGPKGSRIARTLLINPELSVKQRELAATTKLDEGYVSRVVRRLIALDLVERVSDGIRVRDADQLLDAWHDEYRFDRHRVIRGHITAPFGTSVLQTVDREMTRIDQSYAATGLSAAWLLTGFAGYRTDTFYLDSEPSDELINQLSFRLETRGANTWLIVPNDAGVFDGSQRVNGIRCVSPVQVYLDLKSHPERSVEAAEELRKRNLRW